MSDEEWALVAPYLPLMTEDAPQRESPLRQVFNGLRWLVRTGAHWRMMPHDLPPWPVISQQTPRWLTAGVFEALGHDLREVLRLAAGRAGQPTAVICDSRTRQASPERGHRAGDAGAKRRKGSKGHWVVDPLGYLLVRHVTAASAQERAPGAAWAAPVPVTTGETVEVACVDQGDTGAPVAEEAAAHGIRLAVVQLPEAKRGFVLLPRRWGVERRVGGLARFRRLARDYARLPETLAGLHSLAFVILLLRRVVEVLNQSESFNQVEMPVSYALLYSQSQSA